MYTIKAFAKELQTPVSTIRYYEKAGLFEAQRSDNNYRVYSEDDLQQMRLILVMKYAGFSIQEMKELLTIGVEVPLDAECIARTDEIFNLKRHEMVEKIKNFQAIIKLLDMMHPFAIAETTEESSKELDMQINAVFQNTVKE